MGTRTTRIRRTNADFNLLDADDTDNADLKGCAIKKDPRHPRHLRHPRQSDSKYKFSDKLGEEGLLC